MSAQITPLGAESGRLDHLDALRAIAIIQVIALHARGYLPDPPIGAHWMDMLIVLTSTPLFYFADGFLFAPKVSPAAAFNTRRFLVRSARRLLVPWVLFSLIYLAIRAVFETAHLLDDRIVVGQAPAALMKLSFFSGVAYQLYFLPSLFLIRTLAPVVRDVTRDRPVPLVLTFGASLLLFALVEQPLRVLVTDGLDPLRHALFGMRFWLLGLLLYHIDHSLRAHAPRIAGVSLVSAGILHALQVPGSSARVLTQILLIVGAYTLVVGFRHRFMRLASIGRHTMGVFLLHAPVTLKACALVSLSLFSNTTLTLLVTVSGTFAVAYGATRVLERTSLGPLLFGESKSAG